MYRVKREPFANGLPVSCEALAQSLELVVLIFSQPLREAGVQLVRADPELLCRSCAVGL
jgi:hypothetical protein